MRPLVRALLFDWDGTLWDSSEACFRSYARLFAAYGIAFDRARFEETYSPDWHSTYRALGLPEERWREADERWMIEYASEERGPLDGARAVIDRARGRFALGIVTSGSRERVLREVDAFSKGPLFQAVVCGEDVRHRKPHPEGILLALDRLGASPAEAVYVGDSPEDVHMARAASVLSIGVPGPFPNREALAAARPDRLAPSLAEAISALL